AAGTRTRACGAAARVKRGPAIRFEMKRSESNGSFLATCPASPRVPGAGGGIERTIMVDRNLLREFDISDEELSAVVTTDGGEDDFDRIIGEGQNFEIGSIV